MHRGTIFKFCAAAIVVAAQSANDSDRVKNTLQVIPSDLDPGTISNGSPTAPNPDTETSTFVVVKVSGTSTVSSTVTITLEPPLNTLNLPPTWSMPNLPSLAPTPLPEISVNRGAIAGGVIGGFALVIATIAAVFYVRRRSPLRWRRESSFGKWQDLEGKHSGAPSSARAPDTVQNPFIHSNIGSKERQFEHSESRFTRFPTPIKPLFIRDKHRSSPSDPFADFPSSPARISHVRSGSSLGHADDIFIRNHIEMEVNPHSPKHAGEEMKPPVDEEARA